MRNFYIENATEKQKRILQAEKEKYINFMFDKQNEMINTAMTNGENATGWILGSYGGNIQKTTAQQDFHKSLDLMFRPKFEQAGYTIIGNIIKW